jgi:hypothetical protein
MSDDGFNSPTPEQMRIIRAGMPHIKGEIEKRDGERAATAAKNAGVKPGDKFCAICTQPIRIKSKTPVQYCGVCQGRLDNGETALITLDHRYAFISPNDLLRSTLSVDGAVEIDGQKIPAEVIQKMAGQVIGVMPQLIDQLEVKFKVQTEGN